ncbi:MAG: asparaginase [Arenicellales bacterium WSBS_2016_MAG_OTU3]
MFNTQPKPVSANPVLIEVTRGDMVESQHRGAVVIVNDKNEVVASWGDVNRYIFARSALKPIQALPLIETGAADRFGFQEHEIALACSSHNGEEKHAHAVADVLHRAGLEDYHLQCGAHAPLNKQSSDELVHRAYAPSQLHSNCSGKHAGFLATAVHMGEPPHGYIKLDHPVQQRIHNMLVEMTEQDLQRAPLGTDGCGIPVIGLPLTSLAFALARLGTGFGLPPHRRLAAERIRNAMMNNPFWVAGTDRYCTDAMLAGGGEVLVKTGAEGVFAGCLPKQKLGFAIKIDDGATRASEVVASDIINRFGDLPTHKRGFFSNGQRVQVKNIAGELVGVIRPVKEWLD